MFESYRIVECEYNPGAMAGGARGIQSSFSTNWTNCPVIDQNAFSEIGLDLPVIDQNFVNFV